MTQTLDVPSLTRLAQTGPTPLFATVSGAHLYGFASTDSDVDLRGAIVQPLTARLRLDPPAETFTVSRMLDGVEIDWAAHDVRKFAKLMTRRNGYVLEQLFSPLVVLGGQRLDELRAIGAGCVTRHLAHHYRGFGRTVRRALDKPGATVKDLLYLYRVLLTGVHALRTGEIEAHLPTLLDGRRKSAVNELIQRKSSGEHVALEPGEWDHHRPVAAGLDLELDEAFASSQLPEAPTTRDELDNFVVSACLELGDG